MYDILESCCRKITDIQTLKQVQGDVTVVMLTNLVTLIKPRHPDQNSACGLNLVMLNLFLVMQNDDVMLNLFQHLICIDLESSSG